jgi:energy-coupling factor transport system permease protein
MGMLLHTTPVARPEAIDGTLTTVFTIYQSLPTPIHRLHPLTKVLAALPVILAAYFLPWPITPIVLFGGLCICAQIAGVTVRFLRTTLRTLLPLTLSLFLIQGILFPPPGATPFAIGPLTLTVEGLLFAYLISSRLLVFTAVMLLLFLTTHPSDLMLALNERGLPRSISYMILVALQLVPDMAVRAAAILEAQRSRGLETNGVVRRVQALIPLIGPLVIGALMDVEERAMVLESRAYTAPGPKTSLRRLTLAPAEPIVWGGLLILTLALVVWRVIG